MHVQCRYRRTNSKKSLVNYCRIIVVRLVEKDEILLKKRSSPLRKVESWRKRSDWALLSRRTKATTSKKDVELYTSSAGPVLIQIQREYRSNGSPVLIKGSGKYSVCARQIRCSCRQGPVQVSEQNFREKGLSSSEELFSFALSRKKILPWKRKKGSLQQQRLGEKKIEMEKTRGSPLRKAESWRERSGWAHSSRRTKVTIMWSCTAPVQIRFRYMG